MTKPRHIRPSDIRETARLATSAALGLTDLVEALHGVIVDGPRPPAEPPKGRTRGVAGLVYRNVRGVTRAVGAGVDALLGRLVPLLRSPDSSAERDAVLAALNGVLGDHLAAIGSPLETPMELRYRGTPLVLERDLLREARPAASGRLLLFVHGLCMNERSWGRDEAGPGGFSGTLARDLAATELHLRYDTGLHVSTNGRELAGLLEALLERWPCAVEEVSIVGHSLGGLVARSACHYAAASSHSWLRRLRCLVFLGTPHHGAPLERIGNVAQLALAATPWSAPFARLGKIRSAGITDLRYGNLLDEDWEGRDRFAHAPDNRAFVPLPVGVRCYALAASAGRRHGPFGEKLLGDGLVPVPSALGHHAEPGRSLPFPESRTRICLGMKHLDLLTRPEVGEQIAAWLKD
jgi:pimeloyl-ACP methyl ester carboxylesterase